MKECEIINGLRKIGYKNRFSSYEELIAIKEKINKNKLWIHNRIGGYDYPPGISIGDEEFGLVLLKQMHMSDNDPTEYIGYWYNPEVYDNSGIIREYRLTGFQHKEKNIEEYDYRKRLGL